MRALALLLAALALSCAPATRTAAQDASTAPVSTASSKLAEFYTQQFEENETQLVGLASADLDKIVTANDRPCGNMPSLQTRSSTLTPSGCADKYTSINVSCSCMVKYLLNPTTWEFRVKKRTEPMKPTNTLGPSSTLEIDAISTLWVDERLTELCVPARRLESVTWCGGSWMVLTCV